MTLHRTPLLVLAMIVGSVAALRAQAWPAGSVGSDKSIYTKVYIGVGDALAPPSPVQGVRVLLVSAANDTVQLTTDAAGATHAYVRRGVYRLLTLDWVSAGGRDYKWNMPLTIAPGMRDLELTADNAATAPNPVVAEKLSDMGLRGPATTTVAISNGETARSWVATHRRIVDDSGFAWDVFEQRFSRGAVWGTSLALPAVELTLVFNRDDQTRQLDHFPANWRSLANDELAALLATARTVRP